MKNTITQILKNKYDIELDDNGQSRKNYSFDDSVHGYKSELSIYCGFYMNYFTVSLSSGHNIIVEPIHDIVENIENPDLYCEQIYECVKSLEERILKLIESFN